MSLHQIQTENFTQDSLTSGEIISPSMGVGKVVRVLSMYDGVDDFIEVRFYEKKNTCYFPVKNKKHYRLLSSEEVIKDMVNLYNKNNLSVEYDSQKDKIQDFKKILGSNNLSQMVTKYSSIKSTEEDHPQIKLMQEKFYKTFITEITHVLKITKKEAEGLLNL